MKFLKESHEEFLEQSLENLKRYHRTTFGGFPRAISKSILEEIIEGNIADILGEICVGTSSELPERITGEISRGILESTSSAIPSGISSEFHQE